MTQTRSFVTQTKLIHTHNNVQTFVMFFIQGNHILSVHKSKHVTEDRLNVSVHTHTHIYIYIEILYSVGLPYIFVHSVLSPTRFILWFVVT